MPKTTTKTSEEKLSVALGILVDPLGFAARNYENALPATTLYKFAADCAEHVYERVSMLDGAGVLREAIEAARSGDSDRLDVARQNIRRFTRKLARSNPDKKLLRAVQAARDCTKATAQEAAVTACWLATEAADNKDEEIEWQLNRLKEIVA